MSLQQDAKINKMLKRILKTTTFKKYRLDNECKNPDLILFLNPHDLTIYTISFNDKNNTNLDVLTQINNNNTENIFYFKNKNPRDAKNATLAHLKRVHEKGFYLKKTKTTTM